MCPFVSVKPTFFSPELSVYTTIVSLIGALKMVSTNLTIVTIKVKQEMIKVYFSMKPVKKSLISLAGKLNLNFGR